jgi:hypothetical protein
MTQQEIALKVLRSIHAVFVTSILLYVFAAEKIAQPGTNAPARILMAVMTATAVGIILIALAVRRRMVKPAIDKLRLETEDVRAANLWRTGSLISFVLIECVALCGFVLRVKGATRSQTLPFYLLAIFLMLIWTPRLGSVSPAAR